MAREASAVKKKVAKAPDLSRYGQIETPSPFLFPHDAANGLPFPDFPDPLGLGQRAIAATSVFTVPEGRNAGKPFDQCLMLWQRALLVALFGHVDTDTGTRYINEAFMLLARKNGKSYTSAIICILEMLSGREPNAEIVVLAATVAQSRVIFTAIRKILETAPNIARMCRLQDHLHTITYNGPQGQNATIVVASTARPDALHGRSVSLLLIDELHALAGEKGQRAYAALKTSMGARKAPRVIVTTTQSDDPRALNRGEIFRELYDRAQQVRSGKVEDGRMLPIIYMPEAGDDWHSEATWHRVNPGIAGGILDIAELREEYGRAKDSLLLANSFKCLRLNVEPANASGNAWLEPVTVDAATAPVEWDEFNGCDLVLIGVDLASVDDICSAVALGIKGDAYISRGIHAIGGSAFERYTKDTPALRHLDNDGDLAIWPDDGVLLDAFTADVIDLCASLNCKHIAIDPAMASLVTKQMEAAGLQVYHVRQGVISMTPALAWVEQQLLAKRIRMHPGTLPFCMKNAVLVRRGEARGITRENGTTGKKIDAAAALLDAVVLHLSGEVQPMEEWSVEQFIVWSDPNSHSY